MKIIFTIIIVLVIAVGFVFIYQKFTDDDEVDKTIAVEEEIEADVENREELETPSTITGEETEEVDLKILRTKEIMVTDGVQHSVDLKEIMSGGPPKDGIPSIDNPKFISIDEADEWLKDEEPGISFSRGDVHKFYPYQILVWHELVNDTVDGERILVTYCPLCLSGFIFDPLVQDERVEFGTSGKLWKSNLVMYDRKTDSLWSQILGEAIVGEMTGTKLAVLPSDQIRYKNWKQVHPNGQILSRSTGATRFYGRSPYGDYFSVTSLALQLVGGQRDDRLPPGAFIFGIVINDKAKAYLVEAIKDKGELEDEFEGTNLLLRYEKELDVVRVFKKLSDGTLERINPFSNFWFSWVAVHPQTELYK